MPGKREQFISPNETVLPKEAPMDRSLEGREGGIRAVFAQLQEKGTALLKTMGVDSGSHLEKLGLVDNPEAQRAAEKYDDRRQEMMKRIREKLVIATTLAMLTMGAGKTIGAELGTPEEDSQSIRDEQSMVLIEEAREVELPQLKLSENIEVKTPPEEAIVEKDRSTNLVTEEAPATGQNNETPPKEKPLSADEKEFRKLSQAVSDIVGACMGLQKDNCLVTVTGAAVKHIALDSLIPFKRGLTRLKDVAVNEEKMEAGERFGKVVSGIFDLLTDVATLHMGGKGVIKLAQLYRAYQGVNTATAAYTFYVENKKTVHMVLQVIFGDASQERQAVENTLATLEKAGQMRRDTPVPVQEN